MLLGYENEAIKAIEEGEDIEYVVPPVDDPDRNPDRGHHRRPGARGGRFPQLHLVRRRPGTSGPRTATARSTRSWSTRNSSRPRTTCSRSTSSAAGAKSTTSSSTTKPVPSPRSRPNSASPPAADLWRLTRQPSPTQQLPGQASACPGSAPASVVAYVVLYLSLIVLLPLAALVDESLSSGLGTFWDAGHLAAGGRARSS